MKIPVFHYVLSLCLLRAVCGASGETPQPLAGRIPDKLPDLVVLPAPGEVHLDGFLGERVAHNATNRLLKVDVEPLLAGFRHKPGSHPWIGEHIGKWMHAATLAWAYTGDPQLRAKLDYAAAELVKAQEPDGYLGTYTPDKRFGLYEGADWDVWSHKYNLIGLLTYYRYTGNEPALQACRRIGDLLIATFGAGKKSILSAGTHVGMAATSVLEPVVWLYRATGEEKYLAFAQYIVQAWNEPHGPRILDTLLKEKSVFKTANGKAYEMLSNLVGLCELARATGDKRFLEPVLLAWDDIVMRRLYLTGGASQAEHFHGDYDLPNHSGANVSETCVTATWIQLNSQLLRLTGETRYADQLETTFYNHLAAAQRPDGAQWCYFTPLEGTKAYGPGVNCCVSSGPRGMALLPQHAYLKFAAREKDSIDLGVSIFEASHAVFLVAGQKVTLEQKTGFPRSGEVTLQVHTGQPARFGLRIRAPEWTLPIGVILDHGSISDIDTSNRISGWIRIPERSWQEGNQVRIRLNLAPRILLGEHGNDRKAALLWGPMALAFDTALNPQLPPAQVLGFADRGNLPPFMLKPSRDHDLAFETIVRLPRSDKTAKALFTTFADAGATGGRYHIWLAAPGAGLPGNLSLFAFAKESRSRQGNVAGSISDEEAATFVVTFDGSKPAEDWYAVESDQPLTARRIVFNQGRIFHDGGWFDTSKGKPRIEARRTKDGPWEKLGQLDNYPATTATDANGLKEGQSFALRLKTPVKIVALRIVGQPASGDHPSNAFSSCAELQAFAE